MAPRAPAFFHRCAANGGAFASAWWWGFDFGQVLGVVLTPPDDDPAAAATLQLRFKYYQRLEGTIVTPKGGVVRAVTVRAFETGQPSPRATRNLVIP